MNLSLFIEEMLIFLELTTYFIVMRQDIKKSRTMRDFLQL